MSTLLPDLRTMYLGLQLKNPLVASASPLSKIELIPEPLQRATGNYFATMSQATADAVKDYTDEQLELVIDFLGKVNTAAEEVVKGMDGE